MIYAHTLADSIVSFLKTLALGEGVTVMRRRLVTTDLADVLGKRVSVIPLGPNRRLEATDVEQNDLDIRIVVQRKLDGDPDGAKADEAARLVEDIAAAIVGVTLLGAQCQSAKATPTYDPSHLASDDLFDAIVYTTWRIFEDNDGPDA